MTYENRLIYNFCYIGTSFYMNQHVKQILMDKSFPVSLKIRGYLIFKYPKDVYLLEIVKSCESWIIFFDDFNRIAVLMTEKNTIYI